MNPNIIFLIIDSFRSDKFFGVKKTSITPNQITTFSLLLAAFAAVFFSFGIYFFAVIGSLLFIFAKFLDHVDGQLARELKKETNKTNPSNWSN